MRHDMAERNEQVMEMVARELDRNSGIGSSRLHRMAIEIDPSMSELSLRQFHARYPLQIQAARKRAQGGGTRRRAKRQRAPQGARRTQTSAAPASSRDAIRSVFLQFANDFADAKSRSDVVRVLSNVDAYVDRVEKAVT